MKVMGLIFLLLIASACFASNHFLSSAPEGWHWNNVKVPPKPIKNKQTKAAMLTPSERLAEAKKYINNIKAEAVMNPTPENVYRYLVVQQFIMQRSSLFANVAHEVVSTNPSLNYDLKNPTNQLARKAFLNSENTEQRDLAKVVAKHFGLFFFYRGYNKADIAAASVIQNFADRYGFSLIGIPMDGRAISLIKHNLPDVGQAKALGVKALPALFLVNPVSHEVQVFRYGYPSEDELLSDLTTIVKGVKNVQ